MGEPYKQWIARIDRMAERAGLAEPGASYTQRHGQEFWLHAHESDYSPEGAWETYLEDDDGQ